MSTLIFILGGVYHSCVIAVIVLNYSPSVLYLSELEKRIIKPAWLDG
jgi:hypothetical protein